MKKAKKNIRIPNNELINDKQITNIQFPIWKLGIVISFVILVSLFVIKGTAQAKEYDGIWFMGINHDKEILKDTRVREAICRTIDRQTIITDLMSKEVVPLGFIPPGMLGYDPDLKPYLHNIKFAKLLMRDAKYPINDKRLKNLSLLHTDGIFTAAIAEKIAEDLRNIGIKLDLVEVDYRDNDKWVEELASGKHHFFLMGYKPGIKMLFSGEEATVQIDSYNLIEPLFASSGDVNFSNYSNPLVDELLVKLEGLDMALKSERHKKLKEINGFLHKELPAVVLFYIEKL